MEVAAIVVVGARREEAETARTDGHVSSAGERFAGVPLALVDVVGKPVVHHVSDRLRRAGVEAITTLVTEKAGDEEAIGEAGIQTEQLAGGDVWRAAEEAFHMYAGEGAESVLLLRLGPYAEFELSALLRFHSERRQTTTLIFDQNGPLDAALVQTARRNDAAFLIRNRLRGARVPTEPYVTPGYVNRLENARDLRRLAQDALLMRCGVRPHGDEVKPGVWVAEHVRIHRSARVLAPAFVGAHARLRAASVVTRGSVVEHHAEVDCGTVLEDATILPYTYMGAGLDAAHAVAGWGRIAHLRRNAEVEIADSRLLATATTSASWRTLKNAAALAAYLPVQALRGLLSAGRRAQPLVISPPEGELPVPRLEPSSGAVAASNQEPQFGGDFAIVRRYGNE